MLSQFFMVLENQVIAPGKKLARVIKWSIYILIISSIVWYNTYGTVGNYTGDILFDPIRVIRDKPDIFPLNGCLWELMKILIELVTLEELNLQKNKKEKDILRLL